MSAWTLLAIAAVTITLSITAGCASDSENAGDRAAETTRTAESTPPPAATPSPETVAEAASAPAEGEITLVGNLGCGHCNYEKGTACAAAIQTEDGTVYLLDVDSSSELFTKRFGGAEVKVVGVVSEKDGERHVAVTSFEI
jgi:hypothetical protein